MNIQPLKRRIERGLKLRERLYTSLGLELPSHVVWVQRIPKERHPEEERDTSPLYDLDE